jgi:hypothetical protein
METGGNPSHAIPRRKEMHGKGLSSTLQLSPVGKVGFNS